MTEREQKAETTEEVEEVNEVVELVEQIEESDQSDSGPNRELLRHIETYSKYTPVLKSLGRAITRAMILPLIIIYLLYELWPAFDLSKLSGSIFHSLQALWVPLFATQFISFGLERRGLAEKYFAWSSLLCDGLRKSIRAILWAWLPLRFAYIALETFSEGAWNETLGRQLFVLAMLIMAVATFRSAKTLNRWLESYNARFKSLRKTLLLFVPVIPLVIAGLSLTGYHFAAIEMSERAFSTFLFVVSVAMAGGLISRLLLTAQFGIKLRQLDRDEDGEIDNDASIDIREISAQVNRLLRATALVIVVVFSWQLWSNVLPAANILDEIQLWPSTTGVVDGVKQWISLRLLLMALGVAAITLVLSRNLPGLLEITILDRLPLDRGGRYAISFVVKYLVGIAGVILAFRIIGFAWSNVQWMAGALMLGLGFGLQEIFANIVSGLIILIERPVRVGDVITINDVTGTVMRVQLRATTIKDLDFRELIVPNKTFITEDVMNWTLTDRRSRVVHKVGVAYGSNTRLVQDSLLKVARRHPLVQVEPPPSVFFKSFGDSCLDFELLVFIPTREVYPKVQHELNMAIEAEFRARGIEIAFPQQDIHIKNLHEFPVAKRDAA
ncbi:MAG: mechanosensitive ion channel domain-containing protein [Planctomycetota bacterium]